MADADARRERLSRDQRTDQTQPPWSRAEWIGEAHAWIRNTLDRLEIRVSGEIEPVRIRPWSAVLRVPTTQGDVYFKANIPVQRHESALVAKLARRHPDCILEPLAVDTERGWMLLPDGGEVLRRRVRAHRDVAPWREALPIYAQLQLDTAGYLSELLAIGVPDRRLITLPEQVAALLDDVGLLQIDLPDGLTAQEHDELRAYLPRFTALCERLAEYGLPTTIQHGDLGDHNIFVSDSLYRFFDWGDSSISHPFFSLVITLPTVAYGCGWESGHPELHRLRDIYLEPFTRYASRETLEAAFPLAYHIGVMNTALVWRAILSSLSASATAECRCHLPRCLRDILRAAKDAHM